MAKQSLTKIDPEMWPHFCRKCDLTFLSLHDLERHLTGVHHQLSSSDKDYLRSIMITPWEDED